jgi:hypothetical protein
LSLGYANSSIEQEGVVGTIVNVRYSPTAWFHVQAGASRVRTVAPRPGYLVYPPVDEESQFQFHVGAGLGGVRGVNALGAQMFGAAVWLGARN